MNADEHVHAIGADPIALPTHLPDDLAAMLEGVDEDDFGAVASTIAGYLGLDIAVMQFGE